MQALLQNHTPGLDKSTEDSHCTQGRYVSCTSGFFWKTDHGSLLFHTWEPEGDLKYTLVLLAKDAAFSMGRSFYTISPSMQGSWEKAFLWSARKTGGLIPFKCSVMNSFPCSRGQIALSIQERQGRAAICCWKDPGSSWSPGTAHWCRGPRDALILPCQHTEPYFTGGTLHPLCAGNKWNLAWSAAVLIPNSGKSRRILLSAWNTHTKSKARLEGTVKLTILWNNQPHF